MEPEGRNDRSGKAGLLVLTLALCLAMGISLAYLAREQKAARGLGAALDLANLELAQAQSQIKALAGKLDARGTAPPELVSLRPSPSPNRRPPAAPEKAAQPPAGDRRLSQIQSQLAGEKRGLAGALEEARKTRDELSPSVAMTHDEVVALQKRGEVNVYEFRLVKSKKLERVGPIQVGLRNVNSKHKFYGLSMIVDDLRLDKKHVNLFEPIWITLSDRPRPLELVVNQVGKDSVTGYLSEPKYKPEELAAGLPPGDRP
jgi:hypothetical protein